MTDYTITTDFGAKDSLPSGNAAKVIKGSEFTTEFTNIKTAVNSKADTAGDTFTGAVTFDAAVTLNADVTFDTNTMFVDVSANRVGIGNVAPATALDVTGTVTADGLTVDTNTLHVDATNDRVGIGTTSPSAPLDIIGQSIKLTGANPIFYFLDNTNTNTCSLQNTDGNFIYRADSGNQIGNSKHTFTIDGSNAMRIDTTGVGIGTTSPDAKLDVTEVYDTVSNVLSNGSYAAKFSSSGTGDTGRTQGILLSGADANNRGVALLAEAQSTGNAHDFIIATSSTSSTPTERIRIDSSGNVGIGTSSPADKFHVANGSTGAGYLRIANNEGYARLGTDGGNLLLDVGGSEKMRIDTSGNVGIGTDSPTEKLDIDGDSIRLRQSQTPASASATGTQGQIAWDANYIYICTATNTWKRVAIATW